MPWLSRRPAQAGLLVLLAVHVLVGVPLAVVDEHAVLLAGPWVSGAVVLGVGLAVALRCARRDEHPAWQVFLTVAWLVWGSGQLAVAYAQTGPPPWDTTVGDMVQVASLPAALVVVAFLPGGGRVFRTAARVALDASVVGGAATVLLAQTLLAPAAGGGPEPTAVVYTHASLSLVAMAVLGMLRRPPRAMALLFLGLGAYGASITWGLVAVAGSGGATYLDWPAAGAVIGSAGLLVASVGLLRLTASGVARSLEHERALRVQSEPRDLALHVVVSVAAIAALVATTIMIMTSGNRPALTVVAASVSLLGFMAVREAVTMGLRLRVLRRLVEQSRVDPLTGLANRLGLDDVLAETAERGHGHGHGHGDGARDGHGDGSLVVLDVDRFAVVNDVLGARRADDVLRAVAQSLGAPGLPRHSVVARTGGDEFAAWLPGVPPAAAAVVARRLVAAAAEAGTAVTRSGEVQVSLSAGVAGAGRWSIGSDAPGDLAPGEGLLWRASQALAAAKRGTDGAVAVLDEEMAVRVRRRRTVERRLEEVLSPGAAATDPEAGISIAVQPVLDLVTGRVTGVEALARWSPPGLGPVPPDEFIPLAEQSGLVVPLGSRVLRQAVDALHRSRLGRADLAVAVNASAAQLRARPGGRGFTDEVRDVLSAAGMPSARVVVEVTESLLISEEDPAVDELRRLIDAGVRVAVDDFGSGHWALGYLRWLPAQIIKIDRSLVADLGSDRRSEAVVGSIVDLAGRLGMTVVVEGVENAAVACRARELGAGYGQGWHWAAAVPVAEMDATIRELEERHATGEPPRSVPLQRRTRPPAATVG